MTTLSERLAELSGKATAGDWRTRHNKSRTANLLLHEGRGHIGECDSYSEGIWGPSLEQREANATLIVELVNAYRAGRLIVKD